MGDQKPLPGEAELLAQLVEGLQDAHQMLLGDLGEVPGMAARTPNWFERLAEKDPKDWTAAEREEAVRALRAEVGAADAEPSSAAAARTDSR